jgi:hypothetical protein
MSNVCNVKRPKRPAGMRREREWPHHSQNAERPGPEARPNQDHADERISPESVADQVRAGITVAVDQLADARRKADSAAGTLAAAAMHHTPLEPDLAAALAGLTDSAAGHIARAELELVAVV